METTGLKQLFIYFLCVQKYYCFKNIHVFMYKNINNFRIGEDKIQGEALIFEK